MLSSQKSVALVPSLLVQAAFIQTVLRAQLMRLQCFAAEQTDL
jgi:hypothetical protein